MTLLVEKHAGYRQITLQPARSAQRAQHLAMHGAPRRRLGEAEE